MVGSKKGEGLKPRFGEKKQAASIKMFFFVFLIVLEFFFPVGDRHITGYHLL